MWISLKVIAKIKPYCNCLFFQDIIKLRLKSGQTEKQLHEENELMRLKNSALANKLKIREKAAQLEAKTHKEFNEKKSEEYANRFRKEIKQKEEEYAIIKVMKL